MKYLVWLLDILYYLLISFVVIIGFLYGALFSTFIAASMAQGFILLLISMFGVDLWESWMLWHTFRLVSLDLMVIAVVCVVVMLLCRVLRSKLLDKCVGKE